MSNNQKALSLTTMLLCTTFFCGFTNATSNFTNDRISLAYDRENNPIWPEREKNVIHLLKLNDLDYLVAQRGVKEWEKLKKLAENKEEMAVVQVALRDLLALFGETRNTKKGEDALKNAPEGWLLAKCCLGLIYEYGLGTSQKPDKKSAFLLYKKSADKKCSLAQNLCGRCFMYGIGTQQNRPEALKYYKLSANQGNTNAINMVGFLSEGQNDAEAAKNYKLSADQGNSYGQNNYGRCLEYGIGVVKNEHEAANYYKLSADQGNSYGQRYYGSCLKHGTGVAKDEQEAVKYLTLSAAQGNSDAQCSLGDFYEDVVKNEHEAANYYKLSADQGNSYGQNNYGRCLEYGIGVDRNLADALSSYKLSADQEYQKGKDSYARLRQKMLDQGISVPEDQKVSKFPKCPGFRGDPAANAPAPVKTETTAAQFDFEKHVFD
jgi:TPR repeat protein